MTDYDQVVALVRKTKNVSTSFLTIELGLSAKTTAEYIERMECEKIITAPTAQGKRNIIKPKPVYTPEQLLGSG